jgi:hypothetical protein
MSDTDCSRFVHRLPSRDSDFGLSTLFILSPLEQSVSTPSSPAGFPFEDLPIEIATRILQEVASSSPSYCPSLVLVSRRIQDLVYHDCIPHLPIMLQDRKQVLSFYFLVTTRPQVAIRVQSLCITHGHGNGEDLAKQVAIVNACVRLTNLMCTLNTLIAAMSTSRMLLHTQCRHLTLTLVFNSWATSDQIVPLLNQITHLRIVGLTTFEIPKFTLKCLTHLSFFFNFGDLPHVNKMNLSDLDRFPVLDQIVLTVGFWRWSIIGKDAFRAEAFDIDHRLCIFHCPVNWDEGRIWKEGVLGLGGLWNVTRWRAPRRPPSAHLTDSGALIEPNAPVLRPSSYSDS